MIENSALIVDKKAVIDNTELLRSNLNPNSKIISVLIVESIVSYPVNIYLKESISNNNF